MALGGDGNVFGWGGRTRRKQGVQRPTRPAGEQPPADANTPQRAMELQQQGQRSEQDGYVRATVEELLGIGQVALPPSLDLHAPGAPKDSDL